MVSLHMALDFKDYYETLGVTRTATQEEIKQAFRALARIHHPDVAKNKVSGEKKFKEINEAYEVLGDPEKRRRYDELGANWQQPPPQAGQRPGGRPTPEGDFEFGGTGFSDFFESFFGGAGAGRGASRRWNGADPDGFAQPGGDAEADLLVTLEDAFKGTSKKITLRRPGAGGEERTDTYQVRIPAGVHEGQRIRLAGQGGEGRGGGAAGDLYLRVRLARHPDFTVSGSDLYFDLDLAPWEAVLGVQAKVPTLDGTTSVKVPAGTAAKSQLRLRGLGLPNKDGARGDLYAVVNIVTPSPVNAAERALWERLAETSTFKPRRLS